MIYTPPPMGRIKLCKERIDITLPQGMADILTEIAQRAGKNRSDLIADTMREVVKRNGRLADLEAASANAPKVKRKRGAK